MPPLPASFADQLPTSHSSDNLPASAYQAGREDGRHQHVPSSLWVWVCLHRRVCPDSAAVLRADGAAGAAATRVAGAVVG